MGRERTLLYLPHGYSLHIFPGVFISLVSNMAVGLKAAGRAVSNIRQQTNLSYAR